MVNVEEITKGFAEFLDKKFGDISYAASPLTRPTSGVDLRIQSIRGDYSDTAIRGVYKGVEFTAEFYQGKKPSQVNFEFVFKAPKGKRKLVFGDPRSTNLDRGLPRLLSEARIEVKINGDSERYTYQCSLAKDPRQISQMKNIYTAIWDSSLKSAFGQVMSG